MKEKKFYKSALIAIFTTAALSILFSVIHFTLSERIDSGSSIMYFLYYVKVICDLLATFVGYGSIIYAMTCFGWYDSLKVSGIYFLSVLAYWIYQTIASTVFADDLSSATAMYGESTLDLFIFNAFYSLGQLMLSLMLPVLILALIIRKYIKATQTTHFKKFITFKNSVQKAMLLFCIIMTAINILSFILLNVLPYLIQMEFYITSADFKAIITQTALSILENVLLYLAVQYIVFMLSFKFYDANLKS